MSEFARWELAAGGPDPHMVLSGEMSRNESFEERLWRGGCYIAVYNAPFAEAIWREWSWARMQAESQDLEMWLRAKFPLIVTRRERRCVRRPEWMAQYLLGYASLMPQLQELARLRGSPEENFEKCWETVLTVPRLGRYVAIKLLEYYRRYCGFDLRHPDIRPAGGRSPREMLAYLFPEHADVAIHRDTPHELDLANRLAAEAQRRLRDDFGVVTDMFQLQVVLCDYKQSWKGRRQYPGRSIDSEMAYARQAEQLWGVPSRIWEERRRVFPAVQLGEIQGWDVVRKDVAEVLARHRYTWSDQLYDYSQSRADLARPVPRPGVEPPKVQRAGLVPRSYFALPGGPRKAAALPYRGVYPILDGRLYQSANWIKYSNAECKRRIKMLGVTTVVCLWKEDVRLANFGVEHIYQPLPDGKKVPTTLVSGLVESVVKRIRAGGKVVVMCHAGRNRSGLITALVLRELTGCSGKEALEKVRAIRPRAVANAAFEAYVAQLGPKKVKALEPLGVLF